MPNTVRPDLVGADPHHRLGGPVVRSGGVRGGQSLRQSGPQRRHRPGLPQHGSVAHQGRSAVASAIACSSASTCSISSTIPTSARRATSSAARRSARSRGPACRPAKPARRARFSWRRSCRSDAACDVARARCLVAAASVAGWRGARPAAAQRPIKRVLTIHGGPEVIPGQHAIRRGRSRKVLFSHPTIEVDYYAEYLENEEFGRGGGHLVAGLHPAASSVIVRSTL